MFSFYALKIHYFGNTKELCLIKRDIRGKTTADDDKLKFTSHILITTIDFCLKVLACRLIQATN